MPVMEILFSAASAILLLFNRTNIQQTRALTFCYGHISSMLNVMTKKETHYVRSSFDHLLSGRRM